MTADRRAPTRYWLLELRSKITVDEHEPPDPELCFVLTQRFIVAAAVLSQAVESATAMALRKGPGAARPLTAEFVRAEQITLPHELRLEN